MKKILVGIMLLISVAAFARDIDPKMKKALKDINCKYEIYDDGFAFEVKNRTMLVVSAKQATLTGKGYPLVVVCKQRGGITTAMKDWMLKASASDHAGSWIVNANKVGYKVVIPENYTEKDFLMAILWATLKAEEFEKAWN